MNETLTYLLIVLVITYFSVNSQLVKAQALYHCDIFVFYLSYDSSKTLSLLVGC